MLGYFLDGGWMMLPLTICSIVWVAIFIDRIRAFRAAGTTHEDLRKGLRDALDAHDVGKAVTLCEQGNGPVAATFLTGLSLYQRMKARNKTTAEMAVAVSKAMEEYAPKALQGLENRLGYLVLIAGISPLIGMVGTVTGMINTFRSATESGATGIQSLSGGISEALITTVMGLSIAIPCLLVHALLSRVAQSRIRQLEDKTVINY